MNKYLVELIGTFFLVFTIGCTVAPPSTAGNLAPLAIGGVLMVMIFAGGHISGAHYNPAVTLSVFMRGKCPARDLVPYMIAQVAGAALAAPAVTFIKQAVSPTAPELAVTATPLDITSVLSAAILCEALFTFALCYVVLNVATAEGTGGNSFYGLAIGFTVMAGAFAVGGVSGGVFNPAVAVGACMMNLVAWKCIWVYLLANFCAAALAAVVFRLVNGVDEVAVSD